MNSSNTTAATTDPAAAPNSSRRMRKLAVPVAAVAGGVAISLGSGIPTVVGVMTFNHNETLLTQSPRPDASVSVEERSILARFAGRAVEPSTAPPATAPSSSSDRPATTTDTDDPDDTRHQ